MSKQTELNPCPWCGNTTIQKITIGYFNSPRQMYQGCCDGTDGGCGATGPIAYHWRKTWNRRGKSDPSA